VPVVHAAQHVANASCPEAATRRSACGLAFEHFAGGALGRRAHPAAHATNAPITSIRYIRPVCRGALPRPEGKARGRSAGNILLNSIMSAGVDTRNDRSRSIEGRTSPPCQRPGAIEQLSRAYKVMRTTGQGDRRAGRVVEQVLTSMFCQGHVLLVGVPGRPNAAGHRRSATYFTELQARAVTPD